MVALRKVSEKRRLSKSEPPACRVAIAHTRVPGLTVQRKRPVKGLRMERKRLDRHDRLVVASRWHPGFDGPHNQLRATGHV